jgi:peptidoglycan/LPS O-acetylase OafA/YrhL
MLKIENPDLSATRRNVQLDCLRGVAILLVILRHTVLFRIPGWEVSLVQFGWAGVDLFFVLSGFLISGLLFSEYRRNGAIRFARFAVRRALKIYPAFYFLVLITVLARIALHASDPVLRPLLHDVFFIQSYMPGTYGHFWSLSVEEHFYILLPVLLYFMIRCNKPGESNPFRFFPWLFSMTAIGLLLARLWTAKHVVPFAWQTHLFPTHLRFDSLMFGVLLSYWAQFHPRRFWAFARPRYFLFILAGVFLISPGFLLTQETPWMYTYGFTVLYLGFGAILIGMLSAPMELMPKVLQLFLRAFAFIGGFSYSIYLWHVPWLILLGAGGVLRIPYLGVAVFILGSIAVGIMTSRLVEIPMIRVRDRLFPRETAIVRASRGESRKETTTNVTVSSIENPVDVDLLN